MISRLSRLFDSVAGRPAPSSYTWSGFRSPVTFFTVWLISALRFLSPLQWLKYLYRIGFFDRSRFLRGSARVHLASGSNRRPDVPPALTDWYFIAIAVALLIASSLDYLPLNRWAYYPLATLAGLLFVESITWIIYYFLLVKIGHVEEDFVIWSPAEYLLLFPIQILIQGTTVAIFSSTSPLEASLLFIGQGQPTDRLGRLAAALSVVYLGILITALLGSLRQTRSRKSQIWVLLGAGDVTRRLILPALDFIGVKRSQRMVVDLKSVDQLGDFHEQFRQLESGQNNQQGLISDAKLTASQPGIYVIASPTDTHVRYLKLLNEFDRRAVCEKPFTFDKRELLYLQKNLHIFKNTFCLSYYSLDKGLALTFLLDPRILYEKYIDVHLSSSLTANEAMRELGTFENLSVTLMEPDHHQTSKSTTGSLRDIENLAFHAFVLLAQLCGTSARISDFSTSVNYENHFDLLISARLGENWSDVKADFHIAKNSEIKHKMREAWITFTDGQIHIDYDSTVCRVMDASGKDLWSGQVKKEYSKNYFVMFDMIHQWANKERDPRLYDLLPELLWANDVWLDIRSALLLNPQLPR